MSIQVNVFRRKPCERLSKLLPQNLQVMRRQSDPKRPLTKERQFYRNMQTKWSAISQLDGKIFRKIIFWRRSYPNWKISWTQLNYIKLNRARHTSSAQWCGINSKHGKNLLCSLITLPEELINFHLYTIGKNCLAAVRRHLLFGSVIKNNFDEQAIVHFSIEVENFGKRTTKWTTQVAPQSL